MWSCVDLRHERNSVEIVPVHDTVGHEVGVDQCACLPVMLGMAANRAYQLYCSG
jgi:hypothetical protein